MQGCLEKAPSRNSKEGKPICGYEFQIVSQQNVNNNKCLQIAKKRLNISEIATIDILAKYRDGQVHQETLLTKVPTFLWDCSLPLFNCVTEKNADHLSNNEIFRKSGSKKRMTEFVAKNKDLHVRGCSFDRSGLSPLDIAGMLKSFIREKLEPIFYCGDPLLGEMEELLEKEVGIEFDLDASPEFGTFLFILKFLHAMCLKDPAKRLTPHNLAVVFAPSFIQDQNPRSDMGSWERQNARHIGLIEKLIENSHNLVMREPHMKRVRSSSISIDRTKKLDDSRRSSSVLGRIIRIVNRERARKIYGIPISHLRNDASSTPDGRQARSRQKKRTPTPSMRKGVQESLQKDICRRLSMRDNVERSPTGSVLSMSPSICYEQKINEMNNLRRFTDSMTTQPPGEETLSTTRGVLDAENVENMPSPQMEVEEVNLYHRRISDGSYEVPSLASSFGDGISMNYDKPPMQTTYSSLITIPPENGKATVLYGDKLINVPSIDTFLEKPMTTASSIGDLSSRPPCPVPRKTKAPADGFKQPVVKDDDFKLPFPIRNRSRSKSKFEKENFSLDMASIIISSDTQEALDFKANLSQSDRPSLALLKERRQVSTQVAKLERQNSVDERNSPIWPPKSSSRVSSPRNFSESQPSEEDSGM